MASQEDGLRIATKPAVAQKPRRSNQPASALQCSLCRAPFDQSNHEPKLLPCHHSFCLSCLRELSQNRTHFKCPEAECRKKCAVPKEGVDALQENFYVNQMQSIMVPTKQSTELCTENDGNLCEKHLNQPLLFYCKTCELPICMNCTVLDHDKTAGHQITDMASVVKSNQEAMYAKITQIDSSLAEVQSKLNVLKTEMSNLENTKDVAISKLEQTFDRLKAQLDQRKNELKESTNDIYTKHREAIVQNAQDLKSKATHLNQLKDSLLETIQKQDIGTAAELSKGLKSMTKINQLIIDTTQEQAHFDNANLCFQFEHGLHEYMLSIKSLGAIVCDSGLPSRVVIQSTPLTASVKSHIKVQVSDINGCPLSNYLLTAKIERHPTDKQSNKEITLKPQYQQNGVYIFDFTPQLIGSYSIQILFNNNPIWGASENLEVMPNNPVLTFGTQGSGQGELNHPTSVAVSTKGNIYVADMGNKRIQVFDANGVYKTSFAVGGSKSTAYDLTINHATQELICSKVGPNDSGITVGNTIRIFGLRGEKLHNFSNVEMQRSMFVAVNSKGHIITTDSMQNCVYIYSKEGLPVKKFGALGNRSSQFNFPSAIAIGKEDTMLVSDTKNNRIQILNKLGKFLRQIGPQIQTDKDTIELNAPRGICADTAHILIADSSNRILVFTWDIELSGIIGSENSPINEPYNLSLTGDGHVVVADFKNNCIKKYKYK